jgi:REP-associated tyrosine transposase
MYNPDVHHRQSIRLRNFDYSSCGAYFLTLCAQGRECLFGDVERGEVMLSPAGEAVRSAWEELPVHYPRAHLDAFVIMPNHVHGIILLQGPDGTDVGAGLRPAHDLSGMEPQQQGGSKKGRSEKGRSEKGRSEKGRSEKGRSEKGRSETCPYGDGGVPLSEIVRALKSFSARRINHIRDNPGCPVWQRNYYERIIRDEMELAGIRGYIRDNPAQWAEDQENPDVA